MLLGKTCVGNRALVVTSSCSITCLEHDSGIGPQYLQWKPARVAPLALQAADLTCWLMLQLEATCIQDRGLLRQPGAKPPHARGGGMEPHFAQLPRLATTNCANT